jgi:uncharacterized protein YbjT (DUF2867 family)
MTGPATHVVTGASGYTGRYIARRLLDRGAAVRTLTGRPGRPGPFGSRVEAHPYSFDDPGALTRSLEGVDTLFNTYWIRFAKGGLTHDVAARNSDTLFRAARAAGVRRVVHVSITNAALDSALPYFRGKALVERSLKTTGLSHAILKPAIIFGREDILLNNIAWLLRRFPVHPIVGSGDYRVQPVFVEDLADLAVRAAESEDDIELDAVGPEVLSYEEMVRLIADKIGSSVRLVHVRPWAAMLGARMVGLLVRDVVLTQEEIDGLTADLLVSKSGREPTGTTRLSDWLDNSAEHLGARYASELRRHYR